MMARASKNAKQLPLPGFSVEFSSDGPELLIGGLTSAWKAEARPERASYLGGLENFENLGWQR